MHAGIQHRNGAGTCCFLLRVRHALFVTSYTLCHITSLVSTTLVGELLHVAQKVDLSYSDYEGKLASESHLSNIQYLLRCVICMQVIKAFPIMSWVIIYFG